jgi:hypothetical protein
MIEDKSIQIKYQTCNICDALHRNINNNFLSVSFEILEDGDIQVKVVLRMRTEKEDEYIDDFITELEALQQNNCVRSPVIVTGAHELTLLNLVYQLKI